MLRYRQLEPSEEADNLELSLGFLQFVKTAKMKRVFCFLSLLAVASGGKISCPRSPGAAYIVGGKRTNITEVPYQVSLHVWTRFLCGGSIVSATHVVTAAHCVSDNPRANYSVRAGSSQEVYGGVLVPVKKVHYHPKFSLATIDYDVAVLELSFPLKFSDRIKPIKVGEKEPADGELVRASGWGCTHEDSAKSYYLQSVEVPVVKRKTCENNYENYIKITARMICAGLEGKDACQGDSGGPLVSKNTLIGIVSSGVGCGRKGFPGIYANVANPDVRKFIKYYAKV